MNYKNFATNKTTLNQQDLCNNMETFSALESFEKEFKFKGPVLDVGSGSKPLALKKWCDDRKLDYTPFDHNGDDEYVIQGDMHHLKEIFTNKFNTIFCINALEHAISPAVALIEMNRVLEKDGLLVIGLPIGKGHDITDEHYINLTENQFINLRNHFGFEFVKTIRFSNIHFYFVRKVEDWDKDSYLKGC